MREGSNSNNGASPLAQMASPSTGRCVAIDLSSTNARVGVWQNDRLEIILNAQGKRVTPLYVAFTASERLVGAAAKHQLATDPANTVLNTMRLIGHKFSDAVVERGMEDWPFQVICGPDDEPLVMVQLRGEQKTFRPEEFLATVLFEIRQFAESFLGELVTDVVLTVPSCCNIWQRLVVKDAAAMAGLNALRVMDSTFAAAIAYGVGNRSNTHNVLIIALESDSLGVSLVSVKEDGVKVIATTGDQQLGSHDFDDRLVAHFATEIWLKYRMNVVMNSRAVCRLRDAWECAKRTLLTEIEAKIVVYSMFEGVDAHLTITRSRFEDLCGDLLSKTVSLAQNTLRDAEFTTDQVSEVVLVGDSARTPKLQQMLSEQFHGKQPITLSSVDEAVTFGAAVQTSILSGVGDCLGFDDMMLVDATSQSLGLGTADGMMKTVIPRNSQIPTKTSQTFSTSADNQTSVLIEVFEGESSMAVDNRLLGKLYLDGIPPMPRGKPQIKVTFSIDGIGTLSVTAVDKATGRNNSITLEDVKDGVLAELTVAQLTGRETRVICWQAGLYPAHLNAYGVNDITRGAVEAPRPVVTPPGWFENGDNASSTPESEVPSFDVPPPPNRKRKEQHPGAEDLSDRAKQQKRSAARGPTEATGRTPRTLVVASFAQPGTSTVEPPTAQSSTPNPFVVVRTDVFPANVVAAGAEVGDAVEVSRNAPPINSGVGATASTGEGTHHAPRQQHSGNTGSARLLGGMQFLRDVEVHMLRLVANVHRRRRLADRADGEEDSTSSSSNLTSSDAHDSEDQRAELEELRQSIAALQGDLRVATDSIVAHVRNHAGSTQGIQKFRIPSFSSSGAGDMMLMRDVEVHLLRLVTYMERQLLAACSVESPSGSSFSRNSRGVEQVPGHAVKRRTVETLARSIQQLQGDLQMAITALSVRVEQQLAQAQAEEVGQEACFASNGDDTDTEDEYVKQETASDGE
ncbi:hypothetical protein BBJ28_00023675 [Nothophytophthora sp. Chile5]|nr:hypothetical protein BBJ28_00023675 [Nothophytophthora sp. Chile5]